MIEIQLAEHALDTAAVAVVQGVLSSLKSAYREETFGSNFKGTPKYPIRLRFTGDPEQAPWCRAQEAEFTVGDDSTIDDAKYTMALAAVGVSRLGLRLRAGSFTCVGSYQVSGASTRANNLKKISFPSATVEDTGTVKFLPGSRCTADGAEYEFDGIAWRSAGPRWNQFTDSIQNRNTDWLAEVVRSHPQPLVRKAALAALHDQGELVTIALRGDFQEDRIEAATRITQPDLLRELVANAKDIEIRVSAVERVDDQGLLQRVLQSDSEDRVRAAALRKITDPAVVAGVLRDSPSTSGIFTAALERLDLPALGMIEDPSLINTIALKAPKAELRMNALAKMTDTAKIQEIAMNDAALEVRMAAIGRLTDPQILASIVELHPDPQTALAALSHISDQATLSTIALSRAPRGIRNAAMARTTDQNILMNIAIVSPDEDTAKEALRGMKDRALLSAVANRASKTSVWLAAAHAAALPPVPLSGLNNSVAKLLLGPFSDSTGLAGSVSRVASSLRHDLEVSGWRFCDVGKSPRSTPVAGNALLEAARRCGAQTIMTSEATAVRSNKGRYRPVTNVDFKVTFVDVLTGQNVMEEVLREPVRFNFIPVKDGQKAVDKFVKRIRDDAKRNDNDLKKRQKGR